MRITPVREVSQKAVSKIEVPWNECEALVLPWFLDLLDLIANIVTRIPEAKVTDPDLIAEFNRQLGVVEDSDGVDPGTYQAAYAASLRQAQQAAQAKPLTSHQFHHPDDSEGADSQRLYYELNDLLPEGAPRTQDWPQDARNRNYRLSMVQGGISIQGVLVTFARGKDKGSLSVTVAN